MDIDEDKYLEHYGILRRSGRYPWGSGENPTVRSRSFLSLVSDLRSQGLTEAQIAKSLNLTTTELRATNTIARNEKRAADISMAQRLKDKGYSNSAIAERMGLKGESSVRSLLDPGTQVKSNELNSTVNLLKEQLSDKGYLDVGVGVERHLGISRTQFDTALSMMKSEGYEVINVQTDARGNNKTLVKVLAPNGTQYKDVVTNRDQIKLLDVAKNEAGDIVSAPPPISIDSKRVGIRYAEQGGADADGMIYIRPGAKDLTLGGSSYAQVRLMVDGTHYLKGMAIYKDDLPDGVDIEFNTNKSDTGNKLDAMKKLSNDPDLPFGSVTRPVRGNTKSALNIVNEEGDWGDWSNNLSPQMLSKQRPSLAKEQLNKTYAQKLKDFDEINSLTNPEVKKRLLQSFADDVDSSSVHLKAAAMPRQATQVIIPIKSLKDSEVYAPNFRDGERVALIRYPHGGTFEIPEVTVNNRNAEAIKILGKSPRDAVGINSRVAERLSGADFDGDFVLVIPNNTGKVKSTPALEGLKNFDPKSTYRPYDGMKTMGGGIWDAKNNREVMPLGSDGKEKKPSGRTKQTEMGKVSNLITDMTIKGANPSEIARAVRHSMVVIDAEKHHLNYKQSFIDNGIAQLKERYQSHTDSTGKTRSGSSTLISQTSADVRVPHRKRNYKIDPKTGEKIFIETGEGYYVNTPKGKVWTPRTTKSTLGAETKDAHDLSSGRPIEKIYADHSNRLKALGNRARKEMVNTPSQKYSPSAKKVYASEVKTLNAKLNVALKNAPLERQARIVADDVVKRKRQANPDMTNEELKKISGKALTESRTRLGAGKTRVSITDKEWEAIQAGAISGNKLKQILDNTDLEKIKELATPRENRVMTRSVEARARQLLASGRSQAEVADILGVPVSTLNSSIGRMDDDGQ